MCRLKLRVRCLDFVRQSAWHWQGRRGDCAGKHLYCNSARYYGNGAVPVFVEPDKYFNIDADKIEQAITDRTKAIMIVHLYGQASNMRKITEIAQKHISFI